MDGTSSPSEGDAAALPVVREEVEVGKRRLETARVRVRKLVDFQDRVVDVPLKREEVEVRRVAVNRPVEPGQVPVAREDGEVLIVPVLEEVLVIEKRLVLKEELHITRRQRESRAPQRVKLKSERVVVEREPGAGGASGAMEHATDRGELKMQHTLVGVYDNRAEAEAVCNELLGEGFASDEVTVRSNGASAPVERTPSSGAEEEGGIMHFFRSLFGMEDDSRYAQRYTDAVHRGSAVVTVRADSEERLDRAERIMNSHNPVDIEEDGESISGLSAGRDDAQAAARPAASVAGAAGTAGIAGTAQTGSSQTIPVVEEELQVGKRAVERGGVRVFTHVEETPIEEQVRLREERAMVERTAVDRPATQADLAGMREETIEVRETVEEPVVAKRARVVEEVRVGKDISERSETVRDTVRHTEVDVQPLDARTADDYRQHWQSASASSGGRYEDYEPAYRYGAGLATDTRYQGRDWSGFESDAQRDWEGRYPGTWERMKASIRHAWERARS